MTGVIRLPAIGETIDNARAIELCHYFNLLYIAKRIEESPERYKTWKFDGVSGLPDKLLGFLNRNDWSTITYQCALPHDLAYAYGVSGDKTEKKMVDKKFKEDLRKFTDMNSISINLFYYAVRIFGKEKYKMPFTWAFANFNK